MSNFSYFTLQKAIYQTLSGDSTLLAMVNAVYDRPPQGSPYPYITIGESTVSDWSSKTTAGTEEIVKLHIWSRNGGRKETASIMERVYQLLHQASLTVTGQTLILIRFMSSDITLENDGFTYQGIIQFKALLEST